jgi:hypothetical protein
MAYDSYSDSSAPSDSAPEEKDENEDSAESSALLPKSLFSGKDFKVGDEIVLKITHLYSDQFEAIYAPEKSSKEEPELSMEATPMKES